MKHLIATTFDLLSWLESFALTPAYSSGSSSDDVACNCGDDDRCPGRRINSICEISPSCDGCPQAQVEDESTEQFADREGGFDGGESSGGDFGDGDRAAASTAAE